MVSLFSENLVYAFFAETRRYKVPLFFKVHLYTIFAETRNFKVSLFRPKTCDNFCARIGGKLHKFSKKFFF